MSARPFIYVNMAMTVDGKITSATREHPRFASAFDRKNMDRLRAEADGVLIGAGTLRADDPPLGVRDPEMARLRESLGKREALWSIVVSRDLELDPEARFFTAAPGPVVVATIANTGETPPAALAARCEIWRQGEESVDLAALVGRLHERGIERLLVEGGAELNWSFVAADLVDEVNVTIAPVLLGGRDAPTIIAGEGWAMAEHRRMRLASVHQEGDELFCRYRIERLTP